MTSRAGPDPGPGAVPTRSADPAAPGDAVGSRARAVLAFLLAHHDADAEDRTVALAGVRLCARCTGMVAGLALALPLLDRAATASGTLLSVVPQLLFAALPAAAVVDWGYQTVSGRASTNPRRLLSGGLLGAAIADLMVLDALGPPAAAAIGLGILGGYATVCGVAAAVAARRVGAPRGNATGVTEAPIRVGSRPIR